MRPFLRRLAEAHPQVLIIALTSVRDRHEELNAAGLGSRRGVLLCGPPGTGKSAVSAIVAGELAGQFTIAYVEAKAGATVLVEVVAELRRLGGPTLLILEDVDLYVKSRATGSGDGLAQLLEALDGPVTDRLLVLASTNDASTLDTAAIRTGRFDSVVEVGYPTREAASKILATLLAPLPGGDTVDTAAVAARLPERTSGSDLREIVRRAVLSDSELTAAALIAEVGSGRYRADVPGSGHYL